MTVLYLQRIILSYQSHTGLGVVERELEIRGLKPFILLLEKKIELNEVRHSQIPTFG